MKQRLATEKGSPVMVYDGGSPLFACMFTLPDPGSPVTYL